MWHDLVGSFEAFTGRDLRKDQKVSHRIFLLQYFVIIIDIIKLKNNKKGHEATFFLLYLQENWTEVYTIKFTYLCHWPLLVSPFRTFFIRHTTVAFLGNIFFYR